VYANIGMSVKFLSRQTLPLVQKTGVRRNGGLQEAPSAGVDPNQTFIGRIERGSDVLGYYFSRESLMVAEKTVTNFVKCITRPYEQSRNVPDRAQRLG
jgi:hypothetical protein